MSDAVRAAAPDNEAVADERLSAAPSSSDRRAKRRRTGTGSDGATRAGSAPSSSGENDAHAAAEQPSDAEMTAAGGGSGSSSRAKRVRVSRKPPAWTKEEDAAIYRQFSEGRSVKEMRVPGRSAKAVISRYHRMRVSGLLKRQRPGKQSDETQEQVPKKQRRHMTPLGRRWTSHEDDSLMQQYSDGVALEDMHVTDRTVHALKRRLAVLQTRAGVPEPRKRSRPATAVSAPTRRSAKWTADEDAQLRHDVAAGIEPTDMNLPRRSAKAIKARIAMLQLGDRRRGDSAPATAAPAHPDKATTSATLQHSGTGGGGRVSGARAKRPPPKQSLGHATPLRGRWSVEEDDSLMRQLQAGVSPLLITIPGRTARGIEYRITIIPGAAKLARHNLAQHEQDQSPSAASSALPQPSRASSTSLGSKTKRFEPWTPEQDAELVRQLREGVPLHRVTISGRSRKGVSYRARVLPEAAAIVQKPASKARAPSARVQARAAASTDTQQADAAADNSADRVSTRAQAASPTKGSTARSKWSRWSADEDAMLLEQVRQGKPLEDMVIPGRSMRGIEYRLTVLPGAKHLSQVLVKAGQAGPFVDAYLRSNGKVTAVAAASHSARSPKPYVGGQWTPEEDVEVLAQARAGLHVSKIKVGNRNQSGIVNRLRKLIPGFRIAVPSTYLGKGSAAAAAAAAAVAASATASSGARGLSPAARWTPEEDASLVQQLRDGARVLDIRLPRRTWKGIDYRCKVLPEAQAVLAARRQALPQADEAGFSKSGQLWSATEDARLMRQASMGKSLRDIQVNGRNHTGVAKRLRKLRAKGIYKGPPLPVSLPAPRGTPPPSSPHRVIDHDTAATAAAAVAESDRLAYIALPLPPPRPQHRPQDWTVAQDMELLRQYEDGLQPYEMQIASMSVHDIRQRLGQVRDLVERRAAAGATTALGAADNSSAVPAAEQSLSPPPTVLRTNQPWTIQEDNELIAQVSRGHRITEIHVLGRSFESVSKRLNQLIPQATLKTIVARDGASGLLAERPWTAAEDADMLTQAANGVSASDIVVVGRSKESVAQRLKELREERAKTAAQTSSATEGGMGVATAGVVRGVGTAGAGSAAGVTPVTVVAPATIGPAFLPAAIALPDSRAPTPALGSGQSPAAGAAQPAVAGAAQPVVAGAAQPAVAGAAQPAVAGSSQAPSGQAEIASA